MQPEADDDAPLVMMAQAGDLTAFHELIQRHQRGVLNLVYRLTGNRDDADDLAQEVFTKAYFRLGAFRQRSATDRFRNWLYSLARNAAIDHLRRLRRRPAVSLDSLPASHEPAGRNPGSQTAEERERAAALEAAVAGLPERLRTPFVLSQYHGLSHEEIRAVTGGSSKSVELHIYRARLALRKSLAPLLRTNSE